MTGNVGIDVSGDKVRIFDTGTDKGFYLDITTGLATQGAKLWHSNNDGSGSGLDADMLDGYEASATATANTVAVRDANGKLAGDIAGNAATATSATTAATASTANALNTATAYKGLSFTSSGATNGINFNDRTTDTNFWQWYSTGNVAYLYSGIVGYTGNRFTFDYSGNFTAVANVTAYSDETLKTNWRSVGEGFIFELANVKAGIFDRLDTPGLTQVGVSAQSLRNVLPNAIVEDENGLLSVSYGNAAMLACVELAKAVVDLQKRLAKLEVK